MPTRRAVVIKAVRFLAKCPALRSRIRSLPLCQGIMNRNFGIYKQSLGKTGGYFYIFFTNYWCREGVCGADFDIMEL